MKKITVNPLFSLHISAALLTFGKNAHCYLLAVFFHELGHFAFARISGARFRRLTLSASGAEADFGFLSFGQRRFVSAGGPLFSIIYGGIIYQFLPLSADLSVVMGIFNLLPISTFDGGGIFMSIAEEKCGADLFYRVSRITDICGFAVILTAALISFICTGWNYSLFIFAGYILFRILR